MTCVLWIERISILAHEHNMVDEARAHTQHMAFFGSVTVRAMELYCTLAPYINNLSSLTTPESKMASRLMQPVSSNYDKWWRECAKAPHSSSSA